MSSGKIVVTGGAGFIGSRLVKILLDRGYECLVLDNLSVGLPAPAARAGLEFLQMDICDVPGVETALRTFAPDCVVHLAAIHHIPTCEKNAPEALRVNVLGTQSMLDGAERADVKRFVLASSGAVYDWTDGVLDEVTSPLRPADVYSLSKFTNEHQLTITAARESMTGVVARIFNTIGPGDPNAHLIPDVVRQLRTAGEKTTIYLGNTHTSRDYVFVEDTAACLAAMATAELEPGKHVFNIGTGVEHSVLELVDAIARATGTECEVKTDPARVRKVDRPSQRANIKLAETVLNWRARYSFSEAVLRTAQQLN